MSGGRQTSSIVYSNVYPLFLFVLFYVAGISRAYIPAHPTNSTYSAIANGLNVSDVSKLVLEWFPNGSYSQTVSYQLARSESNGVARGALVHFSEASVNNSSAGTNTPWIALVSCDANATQASDTIDIFTLARDKGAVAAVLYSTRSAACIINSEYRDPNYFDQILDIFSVQNVTSANLLEYQFGQLAQNGSMFRDFNSSLLNNSYFDVTQSIDQGYPNAPGYLISTLIAYNATGVDPNTGDPSPGNTTSESDSGSHNTALAMIILYAITGCVSVLFCVVIVSGAIRAIRHPERYGPRAASRWNRGGGGQTRAQGLTRAILDTFPIVKFGSPTTAAAPKGLEDHYTSDLPVEMRDTRTSDPGRPSIQAGSISSQEPMQDNGNMSSLPCSSSVPSPTLNRETQIPSRPSREDIFPEAMGTETCPICIVDFEEGDDLRVLPCDGHHRFHQACVDPWLLELSSACPICRHDFLALENILSGDSDDDDSTGAPDTAPTTSPPQNETRRNRFSRYLQFAQRHRQRQSNANIATTEQVGDVT